MSLPALKCFREWPIALKRLPNSFFLFFLLLWLKKKNMKFTIVTILSVQYIGIKYVHAVQ